MMFSIALSLQVEAEVQLAPPPNDQQLSLLVNNDTDVADDDDEDEVAERQAAALIGDSECVTFVQMPSKDVFVFQIYQSINSANGRAPQF